MLLIDRSSRYFGSFLGWLTTLDRRVSYVIALMLIINCLRGHDFGRLLPADATEGAFANVLIELTQDTIKLKQRGEVARQSVRDFEMKVCADQMLDLYQLHIDGNQNREEIESGTWDAFVNRLNVEWELLVEKSTALAASIVETNATKSQLN